MTPEQKMELAIQRTLQNIGQNVALQQGALKSGYLYTAYVSTLVAESGLNLGMNVQIQNSSNGAFQFPTQPREVYDGAPSYFELANGKGIWELHACCRAEGVSGFDHELDMVILAKQFADTCRVQSTRPQAQELLFLAECKNSGTVAYSVGREFIGLCFEFPLPPMRWRGDDGLGALIGTLSNPNASARAFDFVDARKRLIGASFVEPNHPPRVSTFQQRVQAVLQPYWM